MGKSKKKIKQSDNLELRYKNINPNFKEDADYLDKEGYNNNCAMCAVAFEANMRGQDVQANNFRFGNIEDLNKSRYIEDAFTKNSSNDDNTLWSMGRKKKEWAVNSIEQLMEDWGSGSRGILKVNSGNSRHVMNVINDGKKIIIVDAQRGKHGSVSSMLKGFKTNSMFLLRTDDKEISTKYADWAYKKRGK